MLDELKKIDVSTLDSLIDLKRERDTLRLRLGRLGEAGAQINETVLQRVRTDYEHRLSAIQEKADGLKARARESYATLKPLRDTAQRAFETYRLDEEELKLRHQLGEFDDEEYRDRIANLGEGRKVNEDGLAEISELVARFVGAFDSPEDLDPESAASLMPSSQPAAAPLMQGADENDHTWVTPPEPPPAPAPPPPPVEAAAPPPPPPAPAPPDSPALDASQPATAEAAILEASASGAPAAALRAPKPGQGAHLHALDADIEPSEYPLETLTFIGRTPENQIRIYKPAVSRRHAQIARTDDGWMLRDLSSENGTYVNGQRVTERMLADGDRVQFGTSRFVFKTA